MGSYECDFGRFDKVTAGRGIVPLNLEIPSPKLLSAISSKFHWIRDTPYNDVLFCLLVNLKGQFRASKTGWNPAPRYSFYWPL